MHYDKVTLVVIGKHVTLFVVWPLLSMVGSEEEDGSLSPI